MDGALGVFRASMSPTPCHSFRTAGHALRTRLYAHVNMETLRHMCVIYKRTKCEAALFIVCWHGRQ